MYEMIENLNIQAFFFFAESFLLQNDWDSNRVN